MAYWLPGIGSFDDFLGISVADRNVIRRKLIEYTKEASSLTGHPATDRRT